LIKTKDTRDKTFDQILLLLDKQSKQFDFEEAKEGLKFELNDVFFGNSVGHNEWRYPPQKDLSWDIHLVGIARLDKF
jgi:hypothetical protein